MGYLKLEEGLHGWIERIPDAQGPLRPPEELCVAHAAPRRRREFRAGRVCARRALAHLGQADAAIPAGNDRAPVWPAGVVGSIAHSALFGAAAVAPAERYLSVGIDLLPCGAVSPECLDLLLSEQERRWVDALPGADRLLAADALLGAKEAFFKLQWPVTGAWLDFPEVSVALDLAAGALRIANGRPPALRSLAMGEVRGGFRLLEGCLLAWLLLARG